MTVIRAATQGDFEAVVSLERRVFGLEAWSPQSVEQEFEARSDRSRLLVAADGPIVLGYGVLSYAGGTADVRRIAVDTENRRRGVGSRLLAGLLAAAAEVGCQRVLLEVAADSQAALALYRRHGFAEIDRRRRYYADGADAVVMQRQLAAGSEHQGVSS